MSQDRCVSQPREMIFTELEMSFLRVIHCIADASNFSTCVVKDSKAIEHARVTSF